MRPVTLILIAASLTFFSGSAALSKQKCKQGQIKASIDCPYPPVSIPSGSGTKFMPNPNDFKTVAEFQGAMKQFQMEALVARNSNRLTRAEYNKIKQITDERISGTTQIIHKQ